MKRRWPIALFLLFIYIQPAESIREMIKFPILAEHYMDHRGENRNTNIINFLVAHYMTEDGTDQDAEEDSQLPFKSPDQLSAPGSLTLSLPANSEPFIHPVLLPVTEYLAVDDEHIPSGYLDAIWQPPRNS